MNVHSSDGKAITIIGAYTTTRTDAGGQNYEEDTRIVAFKTAQGIRVIRTFAGETPNLSKLASIDISIRREMLNAEDGIHGMSIIFTPEGSSLKSVDIKQILQGNETEAAPIVKQIDDLSNSSTGTVIPPEIEKFKTARILAIVPLFSITQALIGC